MAIDAFVDTSVVVDLIRLHAPALNWYATQYNLGLSRAVWLEVVEGATNKTRQQSATTILSKFAVVELTAADGQWAATKLAQYNLSHNIDPFDCLIAAASHRLGLTLYTRNMKHFSPLLGTLAQSPY